MNWSGIKENTLLAMETLAAHKFRAGLTILGVFIGVLVVVAVALMIGGIVNLGRDSMITGGPQYETE